MNADKEWYIEKIKEALIARYHLNIEDATAKLEEYDNLNELIDNSETHFYSQSPVYWANYLMS